MLEPLGVAIYAVDLAAPRLLERVALLGAGPIGLLILQALRIAGADEVHVVEPQAHRRAATLDLGAADVAASVEEFLAGPVKGGCPLVVEATNSPAAFRDAVACSRIGGRVVLAGIPDGDAYALPASHARRRELEIAFVRRNGRRLSPRDRTRPLGPRQCREGRFPSGRAGRSAPNVRGAGAQRARLFEGSYPPGGAPSVVSTPTTPKVCLDAHASSVSE